MTYAKDATGPYYHGTRADLGIGDLLVAGRNSNYGDRPVMSWIYFSAALESAIWGAELALGDARQRIYIVEPTGGFVDDPNLTDQKFPGNPTKSYRSREPLRIVGEVAAWTGHPPEQVQAMKDGIARIQREGGKIID